MSFGLGLISQMPIWFRQIYSFGDVLYQLDRLGLFDFILPFLLLFAIVFGILNWTKFAGGNKATIVIIALVIGLLGIRFPIYRDVLAVMSPKLGVGLFVILCLVLLVGLFVPKGGRGIMGWIFMGVGVLIALIIFVQTYAELEWWGGYFNGDLIGWAIIIALLIGIIVAVVVSGSENKSKLSDEMKHTLGSLWGGLKD